VIDLRTAAQQALDWLERETPFTVDEAHATENAICDALKAALKQSEQEQQAEVQALMKMQSELQRQRDYWEEEARRYAGNAEFWKSKNKTLEQPK
jgi:hypothetical protein